MITSSSEKAFLIIATIFILISGNIVLVSAQQQDKSNVFLKIGFAPSKIEQTESEYKIGYVWLENKLGNPITLPNDSTIKLESEHPEIVSVPEQITVSGEHEFAKFSVNTHGIKGQTKIFASHNDQNAF